MVETLPEVQGHPLKNAWGADLVATNSYGDGLYRKDRVGLPPQYTVQAGKANLEGRKLFTIHDKIDAQGNALPVDKDHPWIMIDTAAFLKRQKQGKGEAPAKVTKEAEKQPEPAPQKPGTEKPAKVVPPAPPQPQLQQDLVWVAEKALVMGHLRAKTDSPEYARWRELLIRAQRGALKGKDLKDFKAVTHAVVSPSLVGAMLRTPELRKAADRAKSLLVTEAPEQTPIPEQSQYARATGALDKAKAEAKEKGSIGHGACGICKADADLYFGVCEICLAGWVGEVQRERYEREHVKQR